MEVIQRVQPEYEVILDTPNNRRVNGRLFRLEALRRMALQSPENLETLVEQCLQQLFAEKRLQ